ncbi:hypothetical protein D3C86_1617070 [compost metagenome]
MHFTARNKISRNSTCPSIFKLSQCRGDLSSHLAFIVRKDSRFDDVFVASHHISLDVSDVGRDVLPFGDGCAFGSIFIMTCFKLPFLKQRMVLTLNPDVLTGLLKFIEFWQELAVLDLGVFLALFVFT